MRHLVLRSLLLVILPLLFSATPIAADDCEFRLGFKALRDIIGHETVGACLENENYNALGDSVQRTAGGLMAWRKADNWTAFTDGHRTWVSGPFGVQKRLNTERYFWEADYRDHTPIIERGLCRDADLTTYVLLSYPYFDKDTANKIDEWGNLTDIAVRDRLFVRDREWQRRFNAVEATIRSRFQAITKVSAEGWPAMAFKANTDAMAYHMLVALDLVENYFLAGKNGTWDNETLHRGHFHYKRSLEFIYARPSYSC